MPFGFFVFLRQIFNMKQHSVLRQIQTETFINQALAFFDLTKKHALFNSNIKLYPHSTYAFLFAWGEEESITISQQNEENLDDLRTFYQEKNEWIFGHISYDFKNKLENLSSKNHDRIAFPLLHFFRPKILFVGKEGSIEAYGSESGKQILDDFLNTVHQTPQSISTQQTFQKPELKTRFTPATYQKAFEQLQHHIQFGDIFEANFCQEFYIEDVNIEPFTLYQRLNQLSPTPFSALYGHGTKSLICASPERYLKKEGRRILSQPIKGTARRGKTAEEDASILSQLQNNAKDQAENVMVVDMVRNDLARTAAKASVKVSELMKIYSFPQVHQMISTIESQLRDDKDIFDVLFTTFPMGSMTGAPKIKAMELLDEIEKTARGLFSGTLGYIDPEGNADFNVVIRSILYNAPTRYLSFITGGAITRLSEWEKEYEECLLKAKAIFESLGIDDLS